MVKNPPASAGDTGSTPRLGRSPGEGTHSSILAFLPGRSHGQRSLAGYRPWGHKRARQNLVTKTEDG